MNKSDIYHVSMGIVGSSLTIVGARFLQARTMSVTSGLMVVGGLVVIVASIYSYRTQDLFVINRDAHAWVAAVSATLCGIGLVLVMVLPISGPPA